MFLHYFGATIFLIVAAKTVSSAVLRGVGGWTPKNKPQHLDVSTIKSIIHVRKIGQTMFLNEFTPPRTELLSLKAQKQKK